MHEGDCVSLNLLQKLHGTCWTAHQEDTACIITAVVRGYLYVVVSVADITSNLITCLFKGLLPTRKEQNTFSEGSLYNLWFISFGV